MVESEVLYLSLYACFRAEIEALSARSRVLTCEIEVTFNLDGKRCLLVLIGFPPLSFVPRRGKATRAEECHRQVVEWSRDVQGSLQVL